MTRQRKFSLIVGLVAVLACVLAGPRANAQGDDLVSAAEKGDLARVKALLAAKADVNAKGGKHGATALMRASLNGHLDVVRALLATNADVNASDDLGNTALMGASFMGNVDVVRALLAAKADVNVRMSGSGWTPLMCASMRGNLELVRALLAANADVNAVDGPNNETALDMASQNGHPEVVRALLAAKATNVGNAHRAPPQGAEPATNRAPTRQRQVDELIDAAERGDLAHVKALLAAKVDVNAKDKYGSFALEGASAQGHLVLLR